MTRLTLLVALAALSVTSAYEITNTSIAIKGFNPQSLTNSVAFKFFEVAVADEHTKTDEEYNYGVYNYGQCKTEAALILQAMENYEEWGLQCEYIMIDKWSCETLEKFRWLTVLG